jgi:ABC-type oligopeptide transport system ATPase subunit
MIEARHLTKRYGKAIAVDDVSFGVQPGRVTGFLGPNGAGKSTTMHMILSLDTPGSGSVLVNGKPSGPLRKIPSRLSASTHVNPPRRSAPPSQLEKPMDNAGRTRQRVLAIFVPVTAVLYLGGEALSPKGTNQEVSG